MSDTTLAGKRIAIIATDGVEQVELVEPRTALEKAGGATDLISLSPGSIQAVDHGDKAGTHKVDRLVEEANADDYDGLLIPGGVANPDRLRADENIVRFVSDFFEAGKPVAAIWTTTEAQSSVSGTHGRHNRAQPVGIPVTHKVPDRPAHFSLPAMWRRG
jgi:protease I